MRPLLPLALAALAATPALADPAADYATLRQALPTLYFGNDGGLHLQLNAEVIRRLEGSWTLASPLMGDGATFPEADILAKSCDKLKYQLAASGHLSVTLTLQAKTQPVLIHLSYAGGSSYIATTEEAGQLARLFPGKSVEDLDPQMLYSTLVNTTFQGYLTLLPAGDDLLLLQPLARPPLLMARCD